MQIVLLILVALILVAGLGLLAGNRKTRALAEEARRSVPMAGTLAELPGGAIHYLDLGPRDAPALVMIHGLGGQMHHFTYAMTGLLQGDFRLIVIDRPGCGYSRRDDPGAAELPEQARMIWALLDRLDIARPGLVGHSLGGAVALAMALERPDAVSCLALLAPLTRPDDTPAPAFDGLDVPRIWQRNLLAHTWAVPMARAGAIETLGLVFHPEPWPSDFLERGGAGLGLRPEAFIASVEDYAAADGIAALCPDYATGLKAPGGVLFGVEDAILDPQVQGRPMEEFGLQFSALPGRGHMLPITAPTECAAFVRRMAGRRTA
ncbi:alpha/beta fold hydrolase [Marinibacterium sp. SX1]|uniref:alpha/beta fold hydrolase n=1 Tax=Marinibacterium sp. SX1 TaxID=3388424 RepID=UPI003D16F800